MYGRIRANGVTTLFPMEWREGGAYTVFQARETWVNPVKYSQLPSQSIQLGWVKELGGWHRRGHVWQILLRRIQNFVSDQSLVSAGTDLRITIVRLSLGVGDLSLGVALSLKKKSGICCRATAAAAATLSRGDGATFRIGPFVCKACLLCQLQLADSFSSYPATPFPEFFSLFFFWSWNFLNLKAHSNPCALIFCPNTLLLLFPPNGSPWLLEHFISRVLHYLSIKIVFMLPWSAWMWRNFHLVTFPPAS